MKKIVLMIHLTLFMVPVSVLLSQEYKYGKVSTELLGMNVCPMDSTADAMVTYKFGQVKVVYFTGEGSFKQVFTTKKQIKLFSDNAVNDLGKIEIVYYNPKHGNGKVKLVTFKGKVYNLAGGKETETGIKSENKFETRINNYYVKLSVAVPNIGKNSVLEYQYELESDFIRNLDDWDVQESYPVVYNEFYSGLPEYFKYQTNLTGSIIPVKNNESNGQEVIPYKYTTGGIGLQPKHTEQGSITLNYLNRKVVFENIPAFKPEEYCDNPEAGKAKITNQLVIIAYPNEPIKDMATSFEKLNAHLMEDEDFGKKFRNNDDVVRLPGLDTIADSAKKAKMIYSEFCKKYKWNNSHNYYVFRSFAELNKEGRGGVGDINLHYIAALNNAGILSHPVLISLKGNGRIHPVYPDFSQFNYLVAASEINGKVVLSDPCGGLPFGILGHECFNGDGWLVSPDGGKWQSLANETTSKRTVQTDINLADGFTHYKTLIHDSNYFVYDREGGESDNENTGDSDKLPEWLRGFTVDSFTTIEKTESATRYRLLCRKALDEEDAYYIDPFLLKVFEKNPFVKDVRANPINFPFTSDYKFLTNIKIPDGYSCEVPAGFNIALDDQGTMLLRYSSVFNKYSNSLSVISEFRVRNTYFPADQYTAMKTFMDKAIDKMNQLIVLKKI